LTLFLDVTGHSSNLSHCPGLVGSLNTANNLLPSPFRKNLSTGGTVKYLVDSNIWLELLLNQQKASVVQCLFKTIPTAELAISEFTVCSIGLILTRLNKPDVWRDFVTDVLENGALSRIALDPDGLRETTVARQQFRLDFDDAYQYVVAQQHNLVLISFDTDFDKTFLGRKSPEEILSSFAAHS